MIAPDRRTVLKLIAAGAAASLASCRGADDLIQPLTEQPEGDRPGEVRRYATALPLAGYLRGATGLVVDGRPIKLEGLAGHPASLGATDLFTEVSILDLYDPQRLAAPFGPSGPASWEAFARIMAERLRGGRGERLAILSGRITSPTLLARIGALRTALPGLRHVRWEPFDDDAPRAAAVRAFGRPLTARPRLRDADVVLLLGADPLGPGPEQVALARAWSERRRTGPMPRMYAIEPSLTASGIMADRRIAASPRLLAGACHALATALGGGGSAPDLPPDLARLISDAARDLRGARGRALILAGDGQPADVHGFAAWANGQLAAPQDWIAPVDPVTTPHREGLADLARDLHAGRIDTLIALECNPLYAAPPELGLAEAIACVPLSVAATRYADETSRACRWRVPLSHALEGWHDGRAPDGTAGIAQPLIRPLHDTRTPIELIDLLLDPAGGPGARRRLQDRWATLEAEGWRAAVAGAVVADSAARAETVGAAPLVLPPLPPEGLTVELRPSPTLFDGRFAPNAWAQECPDPITKEVWGASARLHPDDMARLALHDGDRLRMEAGGEVIVPVLAHAGQARGVVTLLAGHGRRDSGAVADGIGSNAWAVSGGRAPRLTRADGRERVPATQHAFRIEGELEKLFPVIASDGAVARPPARASLLPNPPSPGAPAQWAMAIDTDVCIGCNACVVACQAENNVPAIGPEEFAVGRDMHWLRVDRYEHAGGGGFQPVPCMQCEQAPCEPVCPVEASVHDSQGLNNQVYNRCIGTRACQANCPYKVRRFNWLDYADRSLWGEAEDASVAAQRNPDVTVRGRGVMEKCTYCVQRIEAHNRTANAGGSPGAVVTACQSACPTQAIRFGTLGSAEIEGARADRRHYALLEELGTRPRTTYLARRRNEGPA